MIHDLRQLLLMFDQGQWDEIFVNGVYGLERLRGDHQVIEASPFTDQTSMIRTVQEFALSMNLRLDPYQPEAGGMFPERPVRWHVVIPPAAPQGPVISLRLHRMTNIITDSFADPDHNMKTIISAIKQGLTVIICGETGSGKSSLLHALIAQISMNKRVLILEETDELPLSGPLWGKLLTKGHDLSGKGQISYEQLFRIAMRLRPDQLVFGELKGPEVAVFCHGVLSGHKSCMATLHASHTEDMKERFPEIRKLGAIKKLCVVELKRGSPPVIVNADF